MLATLTRVAEDPHALHVACVQDVTRTIEAELLHLPSIERRYIAHALLESALHRMLSDETLQGAAKFRIIVG